VNSRIAFIGLGNMGAPLCSRVGTIGKKLTIYDISQESVQKFQQQFPECPVSVASSIDDLVQDCDLLVTCLPNSSIIEKIADGISRRGFIWIDATSGHPETTRALGVSLQERNIHFIDCAVSGGPAGARAGTLTAMVGGEKGVIEAVRPLFETFAAKIFHCGPTGSGHAVKAANNTLLALNICAVSEVAAVLRDNAVDLPAALEAISNSSGQSKVTKQRFPDFILAGKTYGFSLELLEKDVATYASMNGERKLPSLDLIETVQRAIETARERFGDEAPDHLDLHRLWN
jgi:3-hydroxyisobutyrate dehydrogenase